MRHDPPVPDMIRDDTHEDSEDDEQAETDRQLMSVADQIRSFRVT